MRLLLWLLLLAALATGLAVAARYNDGYALLVMPPWRIELSLNLLLFVLLAGCVAAYFLLHGIASVLRMPAAVSAYRAKRARAKADSALRDAVLCWQEGRFSQAIKSAEQSFDAGHARGLAALIALRAAHGLRDESREALWRQRALDNETGVRAARLKAEVELALDNHDFGLARDLLKQLLDEGGRHIALLRLSLRIHQGLGDWTEVLRLTRQLQKHKALTAEQAAPLRLRAHRENLAALAGDGEQLLRYWKSMADDDRREARLALTAAQALAVAEDCGGAARLIEDFLDHEWDSALVAVYGQCQGGDVVARIAHAERWLVDHPRDGILLLCLGRLCRQKQLWGKAQSYLEASLAIGPTPEAHLELASLLENELEKSGVAERHYRSAAMLYQSQSRGGRKSV